MSFEVYLQWHDRKMDTGAPRAALRKLFPEAQDTNDPNEWTLRYDKRNSCYLALRPLESDADLVHSLCVQRPCGDTRLWQSLFRIMKSGNVVLYFPGECPPLVADKSVTAHLPAEMVETLGEPIVVTSAKEILERIKAG